MKRFPEVLSASAIPDVATVYVAAMRGCSGNPQDSAWLVEFVDGLEPPFPRSEKWIANISTQFGCPVGCRFCDAGHRWHGNLTADEMMAQIRFILDSHPGIAESCRKLKVHFARMGEPALNDAVPEALEILGRSNFSAGLIACVPTVAPAGRRQWFERLLAVKQEMFAGRFQLQFSLNSTDMNFRSEVMPVCLESFEWIADYSKRFRCPEDRRVVLNFALAADAPFDPAVLSGIFDPDACMVKITPLNPTRSGMAAGLSTVLRSEKAGAFDDTVADLVARGFEVLVNVGDPREDEVGSNCGQSVRRIRAGGSHQMDEPVSNG